VLSQSRARAEPEQTWAEDGGTLGMRPGQGWGPLWECARAKDGGARAKGGEA
jgi:hypothetical protein